MQCQLWKIIVLLIFIQRTIRGMERNIIRKNKILIVTQMSSPKLNTKTCVLYELFSMSVPSISKIWIISFKFFNISLAYEYLLGFHFLQLVVKEIFLLKNIITKARSIMSQAKIESFMLMAIKQHILDNDDYRCNWNKTLIN